MTMTWARIFAAATIAMISVQLTTGQESKEKEIVITEPGIYELANLFKQADTVALVKVVSGNAETYGVAVYKAEVLRSFKGTAAGKMIYFGRYVGNRIGWEYILFLRDVAKPISPTSSSSDGYGTVRYAEVFNEGYSSMMTSYECVFKGKAVAQECDYGVRVCTDYIVLPKTTATFPPLTEDTAFGCRWVRKKVFISLLEALQNSKSSQHSPASKVIPRVGLPRQARDVN